MNGRVLVAALLGGLTVFVWGMVSHMVLGFGEAGASLGVSKLPNQAAVLANLAENVPEGGFFVFPFDEDPDKWDAAYAANPSGIASIQPAGTPLAFGRRLGVELATNILGTLLAVLLLGGAASPLLQTFGQRALTGLTLGAFASISIDASYWNWYGFPSAYLVGQMLDQVIGWALALVVAGWWLARKA